ncbi:MAG: HNH endonuclease [Flavobacterium sp.]
MYKVKECKLCSKFFNPVAPSSLYCSDVCKVIMNREATTRSRIKYERKTTTNYGVGKGGANKKGVDNPLYSSGKGFLAANRKRFKLEVKDCERCGVDLSQKEGKNSFCIHHKDHNRKNNPVDFSNWELLCPRCHHIEHDKQTHLNVQRPVREDVQELGVLGNGEEPTGS